MPTRDHLGRRRVMAEDNCGFRNAKETEFHVFYQCQFAYSMPSFMFFVEYFIYVLNFLNELLI